MKPIDQSRTHESMMRGEEGKRRGEGEGEGEAEGESDIEGRRGRSFVTCEKHKRNSSKGETKRKDVTTDGSKEVSDHEN